jgi:hypothetical protein
MKKKAQGLPINVIIVAAIALVVLVVIVAIFTGRIGLFGQKVATTGKECANYYSVKSDGAELDTAASWKTDACSGTEKEVFTALDADQHPTEHCCVTWESGAALRTR